MLKLMVGCCLMMGAALLGAQEKGLLFAHRGGAHEFEENTLAAFQSSYARGLRGFETDVRISKDGHLVILHDNTLARTYNASGSVEHKNIGELRSITSRKGGHPLLFLDDLLAFFQDKPGVYLELEMKTSDRQLYPDERLMEYCSKLLKQALHKKPQGSTYVFTSFDERPLRMVKRVNPEAETLLIVNGPCSSENAQRALALGARRLGCRLEQTTRNQIRDAQKAGLLVTLWPGHSIEDYQLGKALGADALCSDVPVQVFEWLQKQVK